MKIEVSPAPQWGAGPAMGSEVSARRLVLYGEFADGVFVQGYAQAGGGGRVDAAVAHGDAFVDEAGGVWVVEVHELAGVRDVFQPAASMDDGRHAKRAFRLAADHYGPVVGLAQSGNLAAIREATARNLNHHHR